MSVAPDGRPERPRQPPLTGLEMAVLLVLVAGLCGGILIGVVQSHRARPDVTVLLDKDRGASYRVPVNDAGAPELTLVPGIGPARAQRIVDYRAAHGRFASFDDLAAVPGIGRTLARAIAEYCRLEPTVPVDE